MELLQILFEYRWSFLAFALFGLLHSVCAREGFKERVARWTGRHLMDHYWRFSYCSLSYGVLFYAISPLHWGKHPSADFWLIDYPEWVWQIVVALHLVSIVFAYWAFLQADYLEFLGFKQMWRGLRGLLGGGPPEPANLFGTDRLEVGGIYRLVRHPMLAAGFLFLLTSGPSLNNLVYLAMYAVYMGVGGYFEERRLVRIFGEDYLNYRRRVGAFFPKLPFGARPLRS